LKRYAEAVRDWDRAIELDAGPQRTTFRRRRALCLVKAGEAARAAQEANALAGARGASGPTVYDAACVLALTSAATKGNPRLAEGHAARAVELLRGLQAAGYFKTPGRVDHLKKDEDLASLRERDDFKKLLRELPGE
jgi:hypothetical protein